MNISVLALLKSTKFNSFFFFLIYIIIFVLSVSSDFDLQLDKPEVEDDDDNDDEDDSDDDEAEGKLSCFLASSISLKTIFYSDHYYWSPNAISVFLNISNFDVVS